MHGPRVAALLENDHAAAGADPVARRGFRNDAPNLFRRQPLGFRPGQPFPIADPLRNPAAVSPGPDVAFAVLEQAGDHIDRKPVLTLQIAPPTGRTLCQSGIGRHEDLAGVVDKRRVRFICSKQPAVRVDPAFALRNPLHQVVRRARQDPSLAVLYESEPTLRRHALRQPEVLNVPPVPQADGLRAIEPHLARGEDLHATARLRRAAGLRPDPAPMACAARRPAGQQAIRRGQVNAPVVVGIDGTLAPRHAAYGQGDRVELPLALLEKSVTARDQQCSIASAMQGLGPVPRQSYGVALNFEMLPVEAEQTALRGDP